MIQPIIICYLLNKRGVIVFVGFNYIKLENNALGSSPTAGALKPLINKGFFFLHPSLPNIQLQFFILLYFR